MLIGALGLHGTTIHALDGEIGKVDEILFDDKHWTVRYLIVETGHWLSKHKVLLSPMSFGTPDWEGHTLSVNLTRQQIDDSPEADTDEPVSRQWEASHFGYYGWPYYWGGMGGWGSWWYPGALLTKPVSSAEYPPAEAEEKEPESAEYHLRSTKEVIGYGISATDGHIGHVEDFIVDDHSWRIRYIALDTRDWWPEKKILLPSDRIEHVNWPTRSVSLRVSREQVKNAPEWDRTEPVSSVFEDELCRYYSRLRPVDMDLPKHEDPTATVPMF